MVVESSSDNLRQLYSGRFVAVEVASCGNQGPARNRRRSASLDALWRVPTPARNVAPEANMIKLGCWARFDIAESFGFGMSEQTASRVSVQVRPTIQASLRNGPAIILPGAIASKPLWHFKHSTVCGPPLREGPPVGAGRIRRSRT
jgi:hypothetical protein